MPVTSPDGIYYLDNNSPASLIPFSDTLATSVQEALNARSEGQQLRTYRWADAAEQASQAGMQAGDMGYRVDAGATYRWSGVGWVEIPPGPYRYATGTVPATGSASTPPLWYTPAIGVTFPPGLFTKAPMVVVQMEYTSGVQWATISNPPPSTTGFSVQAFRVSATPSGTIRWFAFQMES